MEGGNKEFDFSDKDFEFISDMVKSRVGIMLPYKKKQMVYGRLVRRLRALGIPTFTEYCKLLRDEKKADEELTQFVNAITTNLTGFFREAHHFEHLKSYLQDLQQSKQKSKEASCFRLWSSACSSGQEPYSIAMTVLNSFPSIANIDVKILATDIDTNMLDRAKEGIYHEDAFSKAPPGYMKEYTSSASQESEGMRQVKHSVKDLIRFNQLNLLNAWPMKGLFDVIFCRNVVIYFDKDTQRVLFDRMAEKMHMGAILYIGHSESLFNICDRFESLGQTIYRKIK